MAEMLLALVPLLLLLGSLLLGHYPGFRTIVRLAERVSPWLSPQRARRQARPRSARLQAVSGGLLIAFRLAGRPPPLAP